ncbi:MAG: mechanosensitive ion channel family protein [Solobacterium sp.]|nr:mechanosensitive ion channel family protein [Solobacterium sp.]
MKTIIGIIISIILIVFLLNPQWLPLSAETIARIQELRTEHFLIERSGRITMAHIVTLILAIAVVWLVYTIIKAILHAFAGDDEHSNTIATLLTGLVRYLAVIISFIWGLSILGINTTAVLAGAGIIGLIVGFGAQSLIEDIITGLFIIFEGQYQIGDIIILDDFRGIVRSIGVRTTTIEDTGHNLKVVNNSDIRNFQNRSRKTSLAMSEPSVSYATDLRYLEKVLAANLPQMYEDHKALYKSIPVYYGVQELGDSGVTIRVCVEVDEINVFKAQRQLNRDLKILFDENGIEIPFPQVVVHQGD